MERLRRGDLINISQQGSQIHSQRSPGRQPSPQVTQSTCFDQAQTQNGADQTAHKNVLRLFSRGAALRDHARSANNKQKQEAKRKGYRHLLHKPILRVVRLGEVLDVVLQPLDLALHVGQAALQDLSGHCEETGETDGRCEHMASQTQFRVCILRSAHSKGSYIITLRKTNCSNSPEVKGHYKCTLQIHTIFG